MQQFHDDLGDGIRKFVSDTAGKVVRAIMRNHWIKVYPAARLPVRGR